MTRRTPPATKWHCAKCGHEVTNGVAVSMDPRFATGLCLHGGNSTERDPERVPLLASKDAAERVIDARAQARAVKRALRKQLTNQDLSADEAAALDWHKKALADAAHD